MNQVYLEWSLEPFLCNTYVHMEDILDLYKNQDKLHSYIQQGDSWLVQKWVKIVPMTGYLKICKLLHLFPSIQFALFSILKNILETGSSITGSEI